jgi:hypothetical protein
MVLGWLAFNFKRTALDFITRYGLLLVTGLMVLSSLFAYDRGEALLQLANFLPFFLLFALIPFLFTRMEHLEQLALNLAIASIPINLLALVQYVVRSPWIPRSIRRWPIIHWMRDVPYRDRAMAVFGHPNVFASFLVIVLGLTLGLILQRSLQSEYPVPALRDENLLTIPPLPTHFLYGVAGLSLLGVYTSGSRNGMMVAIALMIFFGLCAKANRRMLMVAIASLVIVLASAFFIGIGGRTLSFGMLTHDPRLGIWKIALDLFRERPWLGWGLGNYKILYPDLSIDPEYPEVLHPHNFWLLLSAETGICVVLGLTLVIGWVCARGVMSLLAPTTLPTHRAILLGYLFAFGSCAAFALFDVTFYDMRINLLNWVVLAAIYGASRILPSVLSEKQPPIAASEDSWNG